MNKSINFKQIYTAYLKCRKGKSAGTQAQTYESNLLNNLLNTQQALQSLTWQPATMRCFIAQNGVKPREIHAPHFKDRIVHHYIVAKLEKIITPKFIYDCAANRKTKGTHFAVNRLQKFMRHQQAKHPQSYYLQLDVFNYFYSIDRKILQNILIRHFKKYLLKIKGKGYQQSNKYQNIKFIYQIIEKILQPITKINYHYGAQQKFNKIPLHKQLTNCAIDKGLPIGNLTSQFFSNVYLNELDQFVKHKLKCKHYIRYVDDFILLHEDKAQLLQWQTKIENFLANKLQLKLKAEKKLRPITNGADFLRYIIKPRYKLVRKRVLNNLQQKLKDIKSQLFCQPNTKHVNAPLIKDYHKPIHLKYLKQLRLYYQFTQQPFIWVSEQGYLANGLKKRILREINTKLPDNESKLAPALRVCEITRDYTEPGLQPRLSIGLGETEVPRPAVVSQFVRVVAEVCIPTQEHGNEGESDSQIGALTLIDLNPELRQLLQSTISSYQGHMIHANYYNNLLNTLSSYIWIYTLYRLHNYQLHQKWQPKNVSKYHEQRQYFINTFPNHICLIQKGNHFEILNQNN